MKFKIFIILLLFSLNLFQYVEIPLQKAKIYSFDDQNQQYLIDEVYYTEALIENNIYEACTFDLTSQYNYIISGNIQFQEERINPQGIQIEKKGKQINSPELVLGNKILFDGGQSYKAQYQINGFELQLQSYFPESYGNGNQDYYIQIQKDTSHVGISLNPQKKKNNFVSQILKATNNYNSQRNVFSFYLQNDEQKLIIGEQIEIRDFRGNFHQTFRNKFNDKWGLLLEDVKIANESFINNFKPNVYFDSTSKYIYIPQIAQQVPHYYFMKVFSKCFKTNQIQNQGYYCDRQNFRYEDYENIDFIFMNKNNEKIKITLKPNQYIQENGDNYELLFKFTQHPQELNSFYFGSSFLSVYQTVFDQKENSIIMYQMNNSYFYPQQNGFALPIIFTILGVVCLLVAGYYILNALKRKKMQIENFQGEFNDNYQMNEQQGRKAGISNYISNPIKENYVAMPEINNQQYYQNQF